MEALLRDVIQRHGGVNRWNAVAAIEARVRFEGLAFRSRFTRLGEVSRVVRISTTEPRAEFGDWPRRGQRGVFTPDAVWIDDGPVSSSESTAASGGTSAHAAGSVGSATQPTAGRKVRRDPRAAFASPIRRIRWDARDLLYFAGYALWNYLTTPFLLAGPGFEAVESDPWNEAGETWRRLEVGFPASIPTHCPRQTFYFDADLRLRRHDYTPGIWAPWARAAHYCEDHVEAGGLLFPTRRTVLPTTASGATRPWPALVRIQLSEVTPVPRSASTV